MQRGACVSTQTTIVKSTQWIVKQGDFHSKKPSICIKYCQPAKQQLLGHLTTLQMQLSSPRQVAQKELCKKKTELAYKGGQSSSMWKLLASQCNKTQLNEQASRTLGCPVILSTRETARLWSNTGVHFTISKQVISDFMLKIIVYDQSPRTAWLSVFLWRHVSYCPLKLLKAQILPVSPQGKRRPARAVHGTHVNQVS